MGRREEERKVRSDKKRDVKPTIPIDLYDCVDRISYITTRPVRDVGESICQIGLRSKVVMEELSKRFRRDFMWQERILFVGQKSREPYLVRDGNPDKRRMSMRFSQPVHDQLGQLAYALDGTISAATGLLLDVAVNDSSIVHQYIARYVHEELDSKRMKQLNEILRYINRNNPYDEPVTLAMFVRYLVEEVVETGGTLKRRLTEWIDRNAD